MNFLLFEFVCVFASALLLVESAEVKLNTSTDLSRYSPENPLQVFLRDSIVIPCSGTVNWALYRTSRDDYASCSSSCSQSTFVASCFDGTINPILFPIAAASGYDVGTTYHFAELDCDPTTCLTGCSNDVALTGTFCRDDNRKFSILVNSIIVATSSSPNDTTTTSVIGAGNTEGLNPTSSTSSTLIIIIAASCGVGLLFIFVAVIVLIVATCICLLKRERKLKKFDMSSRLVDEEVATPPSVSSSNSTTNGNIPEKSKVNLYDAPDINDVNGDLPQNVELYNDTETATIDTTGSVSFSRTAKIKPSEETGYTRGLNRNSPSNNVSTRPKRQPGNVNAGHGGSRTTDHARRDKATPSSNRGETNTVTGSNSSAARKQKEPNASVPKSEQASSKSSNAKPPLRSANASSGSRPSKSTTTPAATAAAANARGPESQPNVSNNNTNRQGLSVTNKVAPQSPSNKQNKPAPSTNIGNSRRQTPTQRGSVSRGASSTPARKTGVDVSASVPLKTAPPARSVAVDVNSSVPTNSGPQRRGQGNTSSSNASQVKAPRRTAPSHPNK